MIIEIEDRFCKVAKVFSEVLSKVQRAAERGDAVHEVEEMTWRGLIETGREMSSRTSRSRRKNSLDQK